MEDRVLPLLIAALLTLAAGAPVAFAQDAAVPPDSTVDVIDSLDVEDADLGVADEAEEIDPALRLDGIDEQLQTLQGEVDRLKKFKFSGYIQVRYDVAEADADTVKVAGSPATITPANQERFYLRRARFKLTYDHSPWSQAVLTIDAGADRQARMLDGYIALTEPRTPEPRHQLWVGQFNTPFGYEIERSSSLRELPERSRMENVLFPGERDRGLKVQSLWAERFEATVAVINGGGTGSAEFPITDPTRGKDVLGRVRALYGTIDVGVSAYGGKATVPLTGPDVQLDRTRFGGEAQAYYQLPKFGGGSLRGEYWAGHNVNSDSTKANIVSPTTANPVTLLRPGTNPNNLATDFAGYYVMWVQNLTESYQVAARYDRYDPNVDVEHDQYERWNVAAHWFYQGLTRLTVSYEIPITDRADGAGGYVDPKDNLWTLELQHTF